MSTAITIRHVPEPVRDELASRAALSGRSLQEYLLARLIEMASRPTVESIVFRARERSRCAGISLDPEAILEARDADRR